MKLLKGIINLSIATSIIFLMIPFNIYADTTIAPTYSSSAQSWVNENGQIHVTNYCEGNNTSTNSCKLTFTVDDNWYGMIYFNGSDSSNTTWISYQPVFIAAGRGEYNYKYWQNSQVVISHVAINSISLVKPDSNVDLSQIIQLLTAIENDTSSIDITVDSTLTQIINVLNELIESNGYLELLTKIRQYNFPFESFMPVKYMFEQDVEIKDVFSNNYWSYPVFEISTNDNVAASRLNAGQTYYFIFYIEKTINGETAFNNTFSLPANCSFTDGLIINRALFGNNYYTIYRASITSSTTQNVIIKYIGSDNINYFPIFFNLSSYKYLSTDFALLYGLSNDLLSNINTIANGTYASSSASSKLENSNNQMASDMNDLAGIESGYNQQFNNSLNDIDFTNPIQNNAGILPAANFVITVFNGLVNNPLSILIIIICILTIGKKVIGK